MHSTSPHWITVNQFSYEWFVLRGILPALLIFSPFITVLQVFEIDDVKAWKSVLISATSYALGLFMISKAPWYLLPLAWAWTGTAVTGVRSAFLWYGLKFTTFSLIKFWVVFASFLAPVLLTEPWCILLLVSKTIQWSNSFLFSSTLEVLCYRPWLCT